MNNKKLITKEGKEQIEKELHELISVERPKVIKEIQHAREQGDLRENSDFDAAKQKQANIEERIKVLSDKLLNIQVVSSHSNIIGVGSKIKYLNMRTNKVEQIMIVGSFESDPFAEIKKISYNTKFVSSIIKNKNDLAPGKIITIALDNNTYKIKILEISK